MKNPEMWSNWRVYSFSTRHCNFKHPDKLGLGALGEDGNPIIIDIKLKRKFKYGTAYFLSYFEHSSCLWFLKDSPAPAGVEFQWDGVRIAGILIWEGKAIDCGMSPLERKGYAKQFLEEYTNWCNGWEG